MMPNLIKKSWTDSIARAVSIEVWLRSMLNLMKRLVGIEFQDLHIVHYLGMQVGFFLSIDYIESRIDF